MIVIPKIVLHIEWIEILTAFLIMMFSASIFGLIVLLTPHAVPDSDFPKPDINGRIRTSWFEHQFRTTNDVAGDNWFTRFFMGCFNYHIAHHLFPSVNHVYYPEVTAIIKKFAENNGLPYRSFPLIASLRKHYQLLKSNSIREDFFEETM
jgi:linoleoyl-CoA desaturase